MIAPTDLLDRWAYDEQRLREIGQDPLAAFAKRYRDELATWWRERELDELTYKEASDYSGLSPETIRKKVASGEIPNAGRKGAPRVLRRDLPTKPVKRNRHPDAISFADEILARRS